MSHHLLRCDLHERCRLARRALCAPRCRGAILLFLSLSYDLRHRLSMIPSSVADAEGDARAGRGRRGVGGSAALHGRGVQERVPPTEPRRRPRAGQGGLPQLGDLLGAGPAGAQFFQMLGNLASSITKARQQREYRIYCGKKLQQKNYSSHFRPLGLAVNKKLGVRLSSRNNPQERNLRTPPTIRGFVMTSSVKTHPSARNAKLISDRL
ncbi:hypothetical protein C7M84_004157 [Penaeus vannamei]|uniref:Uncharacterized protein n=1 Tax=Penaeus vannamei TaxID=6689 RepID=A0A3R7PMZ9_PENVA|nr:hypothetical protein C7M84_004157 [Penaeus vannamei]